MRQYHFVFLRNKILLRHFIGFTVQRLGHQYLPNDKPRRRNHLKVTTSFLLVGLASFKDLRPQRDRGTEEGGHHRRRNQPS